MTRSIVDQTTRDRTRIVPQDLAGLRVEGIGVVRCRNVHHAVYDYRRDLKDAHISTVKNPLGLKLRNVLRSNLLEATESASGIVAIIRWPVVGDLPRKKFGGLHIDYCARACIRVL